MCISSHHHTTMLSATPQIQLLHTVPGKGFQFLAIFKIPLANALFPPVPSHSLYKPHLSVHSGINSEKKKSQKAKCDTSSHNDLQLVTALGICSGHIGAKTLQTKNFKCGWQAILSSGLKWSACVLSWNYTKETKQTKHFSGKTSDTGSNDRRSKYYGYSSFQKSSFFF